MAVDETSNDPAKAAVTGTNTAGGDGVVGHGRRGVVGESPDFQGVYGKSGDNAGIVGEADRFHAVFGISHDTHSGGLFGVSDSEGGFGVIGIAQHGDGIGVSGEGPNIGVRGLTESPGATGVLGANNSDHGQPAAGAGVGVQGNGPDVGVSGLSGGGVGVRGVSQTVVGGRETGTGVLGIGPSVGVEGRGENVGISADGRHTALTAISHGSEATVFVNQRGTGDLIVGRDARQAEVFRVINTGDVQVRGVVLTSDKAVKANFSDVDTQRVLAKLVRIPIQSWNYNTDPVSVRHVGPNAQDFGESFGLNGDDSVHISSIDAQGIALVAIQGVNDKVEQENAQLRMEIAALETRLVALESKR